MATKTNSKPAAKSAAKPAASKTVAQRQTTAVATQDDLPDYMKKGTARGSENVGTSDVVIPRIELAQALSPCLNRNKPEYIEGAQAGMFFNSVTRELYGERVTVVPVFFKKQWLVWKDREQGGGFRGAHDSPQEAALRIKEEPADQQKYFEATETAQQLVLVVKGDGSTEEAVISMARTKLKVSKQWNSMIRLAGGDRFSRMYDLVGVEESSDKGDFYNISILANGFVSEETYHKAEALYEAIASGERNLNVDNSDGDDAPQGDRGTGEY